MAVVHAEGRYLPAAVETARAILVERGVHLQGDEAQEILTELDEEHAAVVASGASPLGLVLGILYFVIVLLRVILT